MPYRCHVDPARRLGEVVVEGLVTTDEVLRAISDLYEHPDWEPGFDALWDGCGITRLVIGPEDVPRVIECVRALQGRLGGGRVAIAVSRELDEEMARLLMHWTREIDGRERRLFTDIEEARAWLGRDASE